MKKRIRHFSKSTLSIVLSLCMLVSCVSVGLIATDAAQINAEEKVGAGPFTIYMIPKSDMANDGDNYRLNYKNTDDTWGNTSFTFTGRTYGGRPVYSTTFSPATSASYNCQLQVDTGGSFSWDLYAGSHNWSDWNGKYFDAKDSGTWSDSITFDTYKLRNGTTDLGTLTWNSSSNKYVLSNKSLTGGTAYKLNVYNDSYGYGSKYFQCDAATWASTTNGNMYAYDTRKDNAVITVTPTITSTFDFEWTLADSQNDNSKVHVKYGTLNVTFPTLYTVTFNANGHGTAPSAQTVQAGNKAAAPTPPTAAGYTFGGWYKESGCTNAWNFSTDTVTSDTTLYAKWTSPLAAPTNVKLNNATSDQTVTATTVGDTVSLTWDSVTNAGSYKVYKGDSLVTTVTTTSYSIEKAYSSNGKYTVVAVPSNTDLYTESNKSTGYTLTVNKKKLSTPTVTINPTDIVLGNTVNLTATDSNSGVTAAQYNLYYYETSVYATDSFKLTSGTAKSITPSTVGAHTYKVVAYPVGGTDNDYYTQSDAASATVINVYSAPYKIAGSLVGTEWSYDSGKEFTTYYGDGLFCYQTSSLSSGTYHFSLYDNSNNQYSGDNNTTNCVITLGEENQYTLTQNTNHKSFEVTGSGVFYVYYDTVNGKIWVTQTTWAVTPHVYYQSYNLETDTHNAAQEGTTGGTVTPNAETLVPKGESVQLSASPAANYTFAGWYSSSTFTNANRIDTANPYSYTPNANGNYYALFKQEVPAHYNVTAVNTDGNADVTVTYNGKSITPGSGTLSVPVGATVTYEISPKTGCRIDSRSPDTLITSDSGQFTMPASATAVTVVASKIDYTLTGVTSPTTGIGTVTFYSDSACTTETEITTAQIGDDFYAKYTFPSSGADSYVFNGFTGSGNGLSDSTTVTDNVAKFTMGYSNVTVTANLIAATPTFTGTWSGMNVLIGESFTYSPGTYTPSGATVAYTFNGSTNSTGSFTAPSTPGNYTLTITITNQPDAHFTAKTATHNVNIKVSYDETTVTYYVDMHDNVFDGNPTLSIVQTASATSSPKTDADNKPYSAALVKQGNSTVYAVSEMKTPIISGSDLYINIAFGSKEKTVVLAASKVGALAASREIWLEAVNEESFTLSVPTATNSTPAVASGYRRIYLAKPYSWQTAETAWENIGIYYWNDNGYEVGWNSGAHMTYLGSDGTGTNNYHYYYADIPKAHDGNKINNIIFQGWYTHQTSGEYDKEQTGDIKGIADSANFFVLSKDGGSFIGTRGDDVTLPAYTRHAKAINANVTEKGAINIAPGGVPTGAVVKYTSSETSVVTVANNGDVTLQGSGTATITVEIRSSLGAMITSGAPNGRPVDTLYYDVAVNIKDPSKFEGFSIMSLNSAVYNFSVKDDNGVYPGYFDIDEVVVTVSGLPRYGTSVQSAIITPGDDITYTEDKEEKTAKASFTVRYAAQNDVFTYQETSSYDNITLTATVVSKSIKRADGERYGFKKWTLNNEDFSGGVKKTTITKGKETVRTTNMNLSKPEGVYVSSGNYVAEFEEYSYVDVTFTFNYEEYVPEVVTVDGKTMTNYFYDPTWAENPSAHTTKTHTAASFEVRQATADTVTNDQLAAAAIQAIEVMPQSNYYDYAINASTITAKAQVDTYNATATVTLQKSPRTYQVYLNGVAFGAPVTYQAYATDSQKKDPHVDTASDWYVADSNASDASVVNAPLVATNTTTYRFRVKGDTYLRTVPTGSADFNRSEVDFSHYEVTHREKTVIVDGEPQTLSLEYLLQNFYIADFFDRNQVIDPANNLPYDDATFVGGGVVYYSMRDNAPNSKTVDAGYVTAEGIANENAIKDMLRGHIEANYNSTLAGAVGTEDAMRIAYGTKIDVTQDEINGRTTGMIYRYLPFENCTVDDNNNITTTVNSDTFRYSNALQSYQYVYASGNENKVTNNGRDMRLYSYYVYSYLTYDQETNVPQTKYEIILSDNYADASTYWAGPTPPPAGQETN